MFPIGDDREAGGGPALVVIALIILNVLAFLLFFEAVGFLALTAGFYTLVQDTFRLAPKRCRRR